MLTKPNWHNQFTPQKYKQQFPRNSLELGTVRRWKSLVIYCLCMCLMLKFQTILGHLHGLEMSDACIILHHWTALLFLHHKTSLFQGLSCSRACELVAILPQQRNINILFLIYHMHRLCHGSTIKHTMQFYILLPPWVQKMHCRNFAIHSIQVNIIDFGMQLFYSCAFVICLPTHIDFKHFQDKKQDISLMATIVFCIFGFEAIPI